MWGVCLSQAVKEDEMLALLTKARDLYAQTANLSSSDSSALSTRRTCLTLSLQVIHPSVCRICVQLRCHRAPITPTSINTTTMLVIFRLLKRM
jgi:hypothetical protein